MANRQDQRTGTGTSGDAKGARGSESGSDGNNRSMDLRDSPMMAHLLDALQSGEDIGHYGRLVFAMVARHFMSRDELTSLLANQPGMDEQQAKALVLQVEGKDYNPPKRDRILEWQAQQDFDICPEMDDPQGCNLYRELRFPDEIYENIGQFWGERAQAEND